ncbi:hypothetical protein PPL_07023 [Heterostelium album PN500]|uniref:Uncharacterized protein n=1 Tax=Heterostelium pallidum (strain ATCC 26659 / Pp 5 / PN500) TaxID=670386 RepID=D3BE70_HETP5|nr:hypothetical protein PPL_07023 [Heterostelium album PN500]EFA80201.1 hypothetical protein PPL_07023 [Heterostelium album PN500]|eukprot:XP_020432321.1 hypothetical protein PPL_07023 [Heterostelium album PN500]
MDYGGSLAPTIILVVDDGDGDVIMVIQSYFEIKCLNAIYDNQLSK